MSLVLDAGALIALDRGDRAMWARLKAARAASDLPITHAGVVGQVWRGGARQARLAQALGGIDVQPLDERLGRAVGELLAAAATADVVDAAVVLLSRAGDRIVTGDVEDIEHLARASSRGVQIIRA